MSAEPAVASGLTSCAAESGTCSFAGTRTVAYGAGGGWRYLSVPGSVACTNDAFGDDPQVGVVKACFYK